MDIQMVKIKGEDYVFFAAQGSEQIHKKHP